MVSRNLRWLAVALPTAAVGLIELLSDSVLDPYLPFPWDTILVTVVVAVLASIFAAITFGQMDRLTASLAERNAEVEARAASASALHGVSLAIASLVDLEAILGATVESARTLLGGELALLVLLGRDGEPVLRARNGPEAAFDPSGAQAGDEVRRFLRPELAGAVLAAPLRRGGSTIGTLAVAGRTAPSHGVDDIETLSSLANQAAIAIENDRLAAELRELAVRHERERIAQEIHDGLAQVLGYVNTKTQAVESLLEAGRLDDARLQMAELSAAARSIYVDVREAIQGLTEPPAEEVDLDVLVRDYATRFAEGAKIAISVQVGPGFEAARVVPATRDQVFAIVREALTNVRKHATARRVTIVMRIDEHHLVVTVADDGRGFDPVHLRPSATDWPQYGMTTMRQRAAAIDGHVTWTSAPGAGTTVELVAPIATTAPRGAGTGSSAVARRQADTPAPLATADDRR